MSKIAQPFLFSWKKVDQSPEIVTLRNLLDALPDEKLLRALEKARKGRRNDYPLQALWRAAVAGVALGHPTVASLIRELLRNAELREVCGFNPLLKDEAVPRDYVFTRFFGRLEKLGPLVDEIFQNLVGALGELLPGMGRHLAADSKALPARGARPGDADYGTKRYESVDRHGALRRQTQHWFGWKLHLLCDAESELPVAWEITEASAGDGPRLRPLVERYAQAQPALAARGETLAADKAYDSAEIKDRLYTRDGLVPLIPPRDTTSLRAGDGMEPLDPGRSDTIYISPTGRVCCRVLPFERDPAKAYASMEFRGFEKDRDSLKFRCPAAAYGIECQNRAACRCRPQVREGSWGRTARVARRRDPRTLLPMHYHSRTFAHAYKRRTAVERIFGRLDAVHGFEEAIVKSRRRMETRVALALIAMLATARSWIERRRPEHMRRLLCAA